jgi:preprotein translocase SecE subunit
MKNVAQFFDGVGKEFVKVMWPSKAELVGSTLVVLALVFAFSCYLGFIDHMLARVMSIILAW